MTKDVLISISGLQFAGGENSEPVEVITSGSYYKKNGRHYILYDEVAEDTAGTTKISSSSGMRCLTSRSAVRRMYI